MLRRWRKWISGEDIRVLDNDVRSPRNINNIEFQEHTISKKKEKNKKKEKTYQENLFIDLIKLLRILRAVLENLFASWD